MNPDEHLTEEQRELLVSADYYDRLNLATAYFPTNNAFTFGDAMEQGTAEEADDQGEVQEDGEEDEDEAEQQIYG